MSISNPVDAAMNNSTVQNTPRLKFRSLKPLPPLGLSEPPSFARALRVRGLIANAPVAIVRPVAEAEATEAWVSVVSLYQAHLQRRTMEQAFAAMRGDVG